MFPLFYALVPALATQFGGRNAWFGKTPPYATVLVVARGSVSPDDLAQHVSDARDAVRAILGPTPTLEEHPDGPEGPEDIQVQIHRLRADDEEAAITISVAMSAALGGTVY